MANMTDKFEFTSITVELEICGKKYDVTMDNNTLKLCRDIQKKAGEMAKQVFEDNNAVSDEKACKFFLDSIDKILGKGSSTVIFMGRQKNMLDAAHLFNFIIRKLTADFRHEMDFLGLSE